MVYFNNYFLILVNREISFTMKKNYFEKTKSFNFFFRINSFKNINKSIHQTNIRKIQNISKKTFTINPPSEKIKKTIFENNNFSNIENTQSFQDNNKKNKNTQEEFDVYEIGIIKFNL